MSSGCYATIGVDQPPESRKNHKRTQKRGKSGGVQSGPAANPHKTDIFTEMWLNDKIGDATIHLEGLMLHRADRGASLTGKLQGGGLAVYVNKVWCQDTVMVSISLIWSL